MTALLSVERLSAGYGELRVLEDVSLEVGAGEVVCLLGANGAGKTTTLMAITGVIGARGGDIVFAGGSLAGVAAHHRVERGIALAPEGRQVFQDCTVEENLLLGAFGRRGRGRRRARLDEVFDLFPRLAERRRQQAGLMSGGEQQMLAIGRALMTDPRLLMLDEPSLGLSPKVALSVYEAVARVAATGLSILLVEQNTQTALSIATRGYVLVHGRVVAAGASAELRDAPVLREAFLGGGSDRLGATPRRAPDEVTAPLLSIRGVEKHFGGVPAIQSFSLSLHRGEFCGLIGPNGAGKTTLMNLLTGYMRPSAGEIVFDGQAIVGLRPYQCCRLGIARTFQIVRPFPEMSVLDNVVTGWMFAGDAASRRRPEADVRAECVALLELVGLGGRLGSPSGSLTLGEKKRLELARALATRPRLLLLDEVLGGLSDAEIVQMCAVLRQVHARGITILMIEHVIRALVRLVDRLVVLNFGRNLRDGPPAEVLADPMVVEAYLGRPLAVDDARHPMTDQLHD
ncbi:MAG: hypothetical protein BGO51_14765 [Rhodospirillales bacterium 69-11]|nr:MAG: hypothetical protein BGO51_14765 [Rhodospirillales bacterium 69-11]